MLKQNNIIKFEIHLLIQLKQQHFRNLLSIFKPLSAIFDLDNSFLLKKRQ